MPDAALILEGGGMRGIYTAGVLDYFLDAKIFFPQIYGVSAGVCHACSYLSRQKGRAKGTVLDFLKDRRYGSFHNLVFTGDYFGVKFVYDEVPNRLLPIDYEAFRNSGQALYAVVTNVETGAPEYVRLGDLQKDMNWLRASASLPALSRLVRLNDTCYLDGGVSDSIPLARSLSDGNPKNVVVLTRPKGYRKPPGSSKILKFWYRKYPAFTRAVAGRPVVYNRSLEQVETEAAAGRAVIIQPDKSLAIGRLEKNEAKLRALYDLGYKDGRDMAEKQPEFFS
jgi:predicted patatin/cPLA2 family phospholipase